MRFFLSVSFFISQVSIENGCIFRFDENESSLQTIVILDFEPSEESIGFTIVFFYLFLCLCHYVLKEIVVKIEGCV